jgi:hypothetical protein
MKRMNWILICVAICCAYANAAQQEKLIRETYARLETYNIAARAFEKEFAGKPFGVDGSLRFELGDFRSGSIKEILDKPYAGLITLPTGDIIALTRGSHAADGGPEEATFAAAWERGQYASVFDPQWTIADAFHFEPEKYYDVDSYTSYQVTVRLEGRSRTYRALALFHDQTNEGRAPEFWDAIVNGVARVSQEKRPPYKTKSATQVEGSSSPVDALVLEDSVGTQAVSVDGETISDDTGGDLGGDTSDQTGGDTSGETGGETASITAQLPPWFSVDFAEHISGEHGGTAEYTGTCTPLVGGLQRCAVVVSNFATFEQGTLDHLTPFFAHIGSRDLTTENRTGSTGTTIQCASATGVAFSTCLLGTTCGTTAQVSLNLGITSASATVTGGNLWHDVNSEHFSCSLPSSGSSNCTASLNGTCPSGTRLISGLCCVSTSTTCSQPFASKCFMYGGDFDFNTCTCDGCYACAGSPIVVDLAGNGIDLSGADAGVEFDLDGNAEKEKLAWTLSGSDDAWLTLDRNGNGIVDNGAELFGNYTPQPDVKNKNGFLALAEFDRTANGGNGDGLIDQQDTIFNSLRLWQDENHNGVSEPNELHTLASLKIVALELEFKESKRADRYGNQFLYRAKVKDAIGGSVGRWAWDVFLVSQ